MPDSVLSGAVPYSHESQLEYQQFFKYKSFAGFQESLIAFRKMDIADRIPDISQIIPLSDPARQDIFDAAAGIAQSIPDDGTDNILSKFACRWVYRYYPACVNRS